MTSSYWHIQDSPYELPGRAPLRCGNCLHFVHRFSASGVCSAVTARFGVGVVGAPDLPRPVLLQWYCRAHEYRAFGGGV